MVLDYHGSAPVPKVSTDRLTWPLCSGITEGPAASPNDEEGWDFSDVAVMALYRRGDLWANADSGHSSSVLPRAGRAYVGLVRARESLPMNGFWAKL